MLPSSVDTGYLFSAAHNETGAKNAVSKLENEYLL